MYERHDWEKGEVITSNLLNNIEEGIVKAVDDLSAHTKNEDIHVAQSDRDKWNGKLVASDVSSYQQKKVTNDDGTAYFKAGDNDTILAKIVEIGAGVYNGEGTSKTSDSPNANNVRLIVNMVVPSAGSVIAVDSQGNLFTRAVSGSAWRGEWQPMISGSVFDELEKRISVLEEKTK